MAIERFPIRRRNQGVPVPMDFPARQEAAKHMNDPTEERIPDRSVAVPEPRAYRRQVQDPSAAVDPPQEPEARRASVRGALETALDGAQLGRRDQQFLSRLIKWDKRTAAAMVSLLWQARLAGRAEVTLTPDQLGVVLAALSDAARYRDSGADSLGCWDCENVPGGWCADHAQDRDRARACTDLRSALGSRADSLQSLPPSHVDEQGSIARVAS
jgi:hypothetical protein